MSIIKFEANTPVTMAFTYDTGKETEGNYGPQFFRKTTNDDSVYLSPIVEDKLTQMGYTKGQEVTICKRLKGKVTTWEVYWPHESPERPLQTQGIPPRPPNGGLASSATPRPAEPTVPLGTLSTVMQSCLKEAVDLGIWTTEYAKSKGYPLAFDADVIQKLAVSLYIQHGKSSNIGAMHRNQMEREHFSGRDSEFAKAGSQAAADAVARRKLAESRGEATESESVPPIAWEDEDLGFLGEPQRAV